MHMGIEKDNRTKERMLPTAACSGGQGYALRLHVVGHGR